MKNNGFDGGLLEYGNLMKRGYAYFVSNAGKIIAAITATVAVLVTFTDVSFAGLGSQSFTSTLALMLVASYLIYFSLEDAGEKLGEECESYTAAEEKYLAAKRKIQPSDIGKLRAFCSQYSAEELEYRRRCYVCEMGYSYEELEAYKDGEKFSKNATRVFKRALRMKAVRMGPQTLLSRERHSGTSELSNPEATKMLSLILRLIPSTLCTFLTVSVMLTAKDGLTAEGVIDSLLKLSALPIIGFKGYSAGYLYVKDTKVLWLETKTRLLESFAMRK